MNGKEFEVTPEAVRVLVAMANTADMDYLNEKQLARRMKMSVKEVRHHLKVLAAFGLVQGGG
jgi:predicted ArsR family transcriptional regulator